MALNTFGTSATSTLSAMQWTRQPNMANVALIAANILDDDNPKHPIVPGAFAFNGRLYVPNRGWLNLQPGDWVAYGSTGFPIVVSSEAKTADWTSA